MNEENKWKEFSKDISNISNTESMPEPKEKTSKSISFSFIFLKKFCKPFL